ncbi:aldehyde dehydrogenase family 3 member H1-like isoform X2 [Aristolochia californica]|uniref:aldehyde dehydrogenase family 3 member H1-like isoform X2 n=1 Tax=Aristolochia californica TaxID=171875 RepID=UPI0035D8280C
MTPVVGENLVQRFDAEAASSLVRDLRKVYASGKTRDYGWRVSQLRMVEKMAAECEKEIFEALRLDLNKPEIESFVHEISLTKASCHTMLKELKHWMAPEKAKTPLTVYPASAEIVSEPLGVILIISTWNYPFPGNTVVLKPSEVSPATSSLLARILPKYVDSSAIRVVEGSVSETSLLLDQRWDKILYTGNARVGKIVMSAAAKHLTPVVMELGGKSPVVVDPNTNLEVTVKRIISGKWGCNNGQTCVSPDYIITTKSFAPKLIEAFKYRLEKFYGKDPLDSKDLSRVVNSNHYNRLTGLLDDDKVSDKIVHGGQRDEKHLYISPTILLDVPQDSLIMKEEIFGPLLPIITVDDIEESFDLIYSRPKPLAAYLFTKDKKLEQKFIGTISAGGMLINDTAIHLTVHSLPFGGVGESGIGSYHGKFSFDAFSHKKAVLHRGFAGDASARYPPFTPKKKAVLRALLNGDIFGLILVLLGWHRT